jgi:hypothetical protein
MRGLNIRGCRERTGGEWWQAVWDPGLDVGLKGTIGGCELISASEHRCVNRKHGLGRNVPIKHKSVGGPDT